MIFLYSNPSPKGQGKFKTKFTSAIMDFRELSRCGLITHIMWKPGSMNHRFGSLDQTKPVHSCKWVSMKSSINKIKNQSDVPEKFGREKGNEWFLGRIPKLTSPWTFSLYQIKFECRMYTNIGFNLCSLSYRTVTIWRGVVLNFSSMVHKLVS